MTRPCSIDGCERPHRGRGLCPTHYARWARHGDGFNRQPDRLHRGGSRLDAAPLLDAIDAELRRLQRGWKGWSNDHGIPTRYLYRWRESGTVCIDHADMVCDALGLHPCEVWGNDYYKAAAA